MNRWQFSSLGLAMGLASASCRQASPEPTCQGCSLLVTAKADNPDIPGNPDNAVRAMKNIYRALVKYREATGQLPARQHILRDLVQHPAYGIKLLEEDVICIDAKTTAYAQSRPVNPDPRYVLAWNTKRPDGIRKPVWPAKGERDIWAFSNHYQRGRYVRTGNIPYSESYGYAIGLFSDGTVVVVPAKDMLAVKRSDRSYFTYFPGETGVSKDALPRDQMSRLLDDQRRANTK